MLDTNTETSENLENQGPVTETTGTAFKEICLIILDHESFFYDQIPENIKLDTDTYDMVYFQVNGLTYIMRRPKSKDSPELHYCEAVLEQIEDIDGVPYTTYYFLGTREGIVVGKSAYDIPALYSEAYAAHRASEFWESDEYNQDMIIESPTENEIQVMTKDFFQKAITLDSKLEELLRPFVTPKLSLINDFKKPPDISITDTKIKLK